MQRMIKPLAVLTGSGVLLMAFAASVLASPTDCAHWNTRDFFEQATAAQVRDCLASGAVPEREG